MSGPDATRMIRAARAVVYRALLDPAAVERWRAPDGMTAAVHLWEPVAGRSLRVSLTYEDPSRAGKSSPVTDTYRGTFTELVPDTRLVEVLEFETDDPVLAGPLTVTTTLADAAGGTRVTVAFAGLPPAVSPEDNATGTTMSLANLAALVEAG